MPVKNSKLSSWAAGGDPELQANSHSTRLNQWAAGEAAVPDKPKASIIKRLVEWAEGAGYTEAPQMEKPKAAPAAASKPAPAAKPTSPKPVPAPAKPTAASQTNLNNESAAALADRLAGLQNELALTDQNRQIQGAQKELKSVRGSLRDCRTRGYIFQKNLETRTDELEKQATELRRSFDEQVRTLKVEAEKVEALLAKNVTTANGALNVLENKIQAASKTLEGDFETLQEQTTQLSQTVRTIAWVLDQVEQASFSLTASESIVDAAQAIWKSGSGGNDVRGVLYLTDLRLLFERKDEKVTKTILFVPTEKQKLQNLAWEAHIQLVEKALSSQQGLLGMNEQLEIRFAVGGPYSQVILQIEGTAETSVTSAAWASSIGRVKSGVVDQDRTTPRDSQNTTAAKLPANCPTCGAVFNQTVLRGQTEVKCQYCGLIVRL